MKSNWFHILTALASGELHGLGIVRSVLDQTAGRVHLWPATLYGSLEDLAAAGLIREIDRDELAADVSAQRRYYRLTESGRQALRDEARTLGTMAAVALERLGPA